MERPADPDFAWYRLQGREIAVLIGLGVVLIGLSSWTWLRDSGFHEVPATHEQLPPARVNVNTASLGELTALPGIGERKAERIVQARTVARIGSLDDLAKAAGGIPARDLERMKDYVVFD